MVDCYVKNNVGRQSIGGLAALCRKLARIKTVGK